MDDGSRDGTGDFVRRAVADWPQLALIQHPINLGKGAAVRTGMLAARGREVLFADADGATPIDQECKLREAIAAGAEVAIGVRGRGIAGGPNADRRWIRGLAGRVFSSIAGAYLSLPVADTQCGFKIFARGVVPPLFGPCREAGYLFDLYVLKAAQRLGYRIAEIPVDWKEIRGSKVCIIRDSWDMFTGLERIRREFARSGNLPGPTAAAAAGIPPPPSSEPYVRGVPPASDPAPDAFPGPAVFPSPARA